MNTLICTACELQLVPSRMGVYVIQHAEFGPSAIWKADEAKCPKCGLKVACHFSDKPLAEYWNIKPFEEVMKVVRKRPENIIHCYELARPEGGRTCPLRPNC